MSRDATDADRALTAAEQLRDVADGLDGILDAFEVMEGESPGDVVVAEVREWLTDRLRPALVRLPADWPTRPEAEL